VTIKNVPKFTTGTGRAGHRGWPSIADLGRSHDVHKFTRLALLRLRSRHPGKEDAQTVTIVRPALLSPELGEKAMLKVGATPNAMTDNYIDNREYKLLTFVRHLRKLPSGSPHAPTTDTA
jgi:hypothetical protein